METLSKPASFREYIPAMDWKWSRELAQADAYQWAEQRPADPFVQNWMAVWKKLDESPFQGITTSGEVLPGLYCLVVGDEDFGAPTQDMVMAAELVLSSANEFERRSMVYSIDAPEWRRWINPEIYLFRNGVRLEEVSE